MKEITNKEIKEIAKRIINKVNESENDYDAFDEIFDILIDTFSKMNIAVEKIKNNPDCVCTNCNCS